MVDRAQPGAIDSIIRGDELRQIFGRFSDGFIVPGSDPTPAAQRRGDINETVLDSFALTTASGSSLDVTVAPGEGFVGGWFCRDVSTTLTLPANVTVDIVVGFDDRAIFDPNVDADRDDADTVIVDLAQNVKNILPTTIAHRVTTDGSGVTSNERIANVGSSIQADSLSPSSLTDQITDTQLDTTSGFFNFSSNDVRLNTGQVIETPSASRIELGSNTVLSADDGTQEFIARNSDTAIGRFAGNGQPQETATGFGAAELNQGESVTATGRNSAGDNGGDDLTATGDSAGRENTGDNVTVTGRGAGLVNTGNDVTSNGVRSAFDNDGSDVIASGRNAAKNNSGNGVIAIGQDAGINNSQNDIMIITDQNGNRRMELDLSNGDLSIEGSLNQNANL